MSECRIVARPAVAVPSRAVWRASRGSEERLVAPGRAPTALRRALARVRADGRERGWERLGSARAGD